jgi:hypothetical protein
MARSARGSCQWQVCLATALETQWAGGWALVDSSASILIETLWTQRLLRHSQISDKDRSLEENMAFHSFVPFFYHPNQIYSWTRVKTFLDVNQTSVMELNCHWHTTSGYRRIAGLQQCSGVAPKVCCTLLKALGVSYQADLEAEAAVRAEIKLVLDSTFFFSTLGFEFRA